VTFTWLLDVKSLLLVDEPSQGDDGPSYRHLSCELALLCRMTYDVDGSDLEELLSSHNDIRILVECAIAVQESRPVLLSQAPFHLRTMLCRDLRLAHRLQRRLSSRITDNWSGFVSAVISVWPDFAVGSGKGFLPGELWLSVDTASRPGRKVLRVFYNMLDGQLLVDGRPLGRLPSEITSHKTYIRTFGKVNVSITLI
jgi:hypothetical protein